MVNTPRLIKNNTNTLRKDVFTDLQLDKILSEHTVSVLSSPCEKDQLPLRNELFELLDKEGTSRLESILTALTKCERVLRLKEEERLPLDRFYRSVEALEAYADACTELASSCGCGELLEEVSEYYSSGEMMARLSRIKGSSQNIRALLEGMSTGLLSLSDKMWLTPDYNAVTELDLISECASGLGLSSPSKRIQNARIDASFSDAVCSLYEKEASEIISELEKYSDIDLAEPLSYIPEIKFFLEIHGLIRRASKMGVPHCISKIAVEPKFSSKGLYDVSLLAKESKSIVPNDALFNETEPFSFLVGANGGGKTTYLRAVGINLILFTSGCPVFAEEAEIYPFDTVLTHFPRDERFDGMGRLDEEKLRVDAMLEASLGRRAFMLFNETFSGTDEKRGFELLTETAKAIEAGEHFGIYVTHFHKVMSLAYPVLSAEVDKSDENRRTFRIVRSKGRSFSYAYDILKKYRLDKDSLSDRRM